MSDIKVGTYHGQLLGWTESADAISILEFTADAHISGYGPACTIHLEFKPDGESGSVSWEFRSYKIKNADTGSYETKEEKGINELKKVQ